MLLAVVASVNANAEPEAEADPYYLYSGLYGGYRGYLGYPYRAYGGYYGYRPCRNKNTFLPFLLLIS